ncbi:uncharacterized protein LOC129004850 isoform X2 [Macrosteles quadrilineatus]|uniref:uncharacterized protein LOC129004850 isoform X2 n=1 Tax=Macrosteles quadrilineatus TaxID=74068 RepID=UPI0023E16FBC|nr:uncharacterized protein LOC129004850 isoform X2 [Macrosteles quadrilineatus]
MTRVPRGRRCVTPDPVPRPSQERTLLVLDLRRSHSQETLSCHASGLPTTILQPPTRSPTPSSGTGMTTTRKQNKPRNRLSPDHLTRPEDALAKPAMMSLPPPTVGEDESLPRRRGRLKKKGKKSGRDLSAGIEKEVKGFPEPGETQVSAFGIDSRLASARASLTMQGGEGGSVTPLEGDCGPLHTPEPSYLDYDILKQLRRELDQEVIDSEFDVKRRIALQEALRTFPADNKLQHNEEMIKLQKELRLPPENTELWLSLPRTFSRQSARFELPLDRRQLNTMTPLEYVQRHISITSHRRLLYSRVFNRHKKQIDLEDTEQENTHRTLSGKNMTVALGEMMGRPFTEEEAVWFQEIVGWKDEDWIDFRTWCGICALCERILGMSQVLLSTPIQRSRSSNRSRTGRL